nr:hypothetical protein [Methanobrevibacter sp.]
YMVPSFVIVLDNIPLTVNGKVDERALPDIDFESLHVEYMAPESETEKLVVNAFENVFNHKIGIYDDFIRLGGDSLKAIQISSQLYKSGIKCNANSILNEKTPFNIAKSIDGSKNENGFYLAKKGSSGQNMFILPPVLGASFSLLKLVNKLDYDGNVYLIDDFKFNLSKEEIKNTNQTMSLNYYYEAIKDVFQDGDIIAGYSAGCLFVLLLAEKLEQFKKIDKCILIDGTLSFTQDEILPREEALKILEEFSERDYGEKFSTSEPYAEFRDKLIGIMIVNSVWDFPTPEISSHVLYLATSTKHKEKLDNIAPDNEFILIDSNHDDIIDKDVGKIVKYFK